MDKEQVLGLLRDFLKVLGTSLTAHGIVTSSDWSTWSGIIITLAPIGWSVYERTHARMVAKVDALPGVAGVVAHNTVEGRQLADDITSATVAVAGTHAAAAVAKA